MKDIYNYWNNRTPYTWGDYDEMKHLRFTLQDYMTRVFQYSKFRDKKILEIGCGSGIDSVEFAKHGAKIYATDLTENAIKTTKKLFSKLKLKAEDIKKMDVTEISYDKNFFDLVYIYGILHHIPNIQIALKEIYAVIKPDGECYAMVYNKESMLYYYSILYLHGVMEKGFEKGYTEQQLLSTYSEGETGCPYTKAYTEQEIYSLFKKAGFKEVDTQIEYPAIDTIHERKNKIPNLPRNYGWHIIIKAKK